MAANARYSLPAGYDNHAKSNGSGGKPTLPHIDDVVAFPADVDSNKPLKWLLEQAEMSLRQSEMSRDFNRPALALKDFIRASVITVQLVSHHKDYLTLKEGRGELARQHSALMNRIKQQSDIYDQIKQDIIADNRRTGVLPKSQKPKQPELNGNHSSPAAPSSNGPPSITPSGKVKPKVQPKPQSLQGKAVAGHARSASTNAVHIDLAARFANLRGPQATPGQDPRIKTHSIQQIKPAGPREMPASPQKSHPTMSSGVPSLPKMPEAIYQPARGSISSDAGRPPATTPRSSYIRSTPTPTASSMPSPVSGRQSMEYFPPISSNLTGNKPLQNTVPDSDHDSVTAEELFAAMKRRGSVLIIDIRSRTEFDEGHIMSSSTICIEASILLRDNISAAEISESLILSPNQEQAQFDRRNEYELVVFYDQDSEEIPRSPRSSDDMVIVALHRALVHFNYERELRQPPRILRGGLDAWVDLMGSASLQATSGSSNSMPVPSSRARSGTFQRRHSKYIRPLRPDEVKVWQQTLENEELSTNQPPEYHRSTESFLRRYPPVLTEQESMTSSPASEQPPPRYGSLQRIDPYSDLPSPPTRPAPSVPRLSYSSLSHTSDEADRFDEPTTPRQTIRTAKPEPTSGDGYKFYTGLNNPHNWCYANSTLQTLLASPEFGKELSDSTWTAEYKAPRKDNEKIDHPQIMIRILSNLFHWMSTGNLEVMKAQTLMVRMLTVTTDWATC